MRRLIASRISTNAPRYRAGFTLIELLAVMAVLAILLSVAIPVIRPALKDRKLRETSRLLNAYVAGVQARAAELGRPVGVILVRGSSTNARDKYQCTEIFTAEVPAPYAGDMVDSRARVTTSGGNWTVSLAGNPFFNTLVKAPARDATGSIVTAGDLFALRLDYKDPLFQCRCIGPGQAQILFTKNDLTRPPQQYVNSDGTSKRPVPFQIYRTPARSSATPLQLPNGVAIDLSVSGMGFQGNHFSPDFRPDSKLWQQSITIMFAANGNVDSVFIGGQPLPQPSKIYLLVGRVNQISAKGMLDPDATDPFKRPTQSDRNRANLPDPANTWFTINPKTGHIRNSANRADLIIYPGDGSSPLLGPGIQQARQDAIQGIGVGGR
ncbi:MAG: type II secretion system protein [Pirellulaceae bacterium]